MNQPPTGSTVFAYDDFHDVPPLGDALVRGSGCPTDRSAALHDGVWSGRIIALDPDSTDAGTIVFDPFCAHTGAAGEAFVAQLEDSHDGPLNPDYVRLAADSGQILVPYRPGSFAVHLGVVEGGRCVDTGPTSTTFAAGQFPYDTHDAWLFIEEGAAAAVFIACQPVPGFVVGARPNPMPPTSTTPPPTTPAATTVAPTPPPTPPPATDVAAALTYTSVDGAWTVAFPPGADPQVTSSDIDGTTATIHVAVVDGDEYAVAEAHPGGTVDLRGAVVFGVNAVSGTLTSDQTIDIDGRPARRYSAAVDSDNVTATLHGVVIDNSGVLVMVMAIDRGSDSPDAAEGFLASFSFQGDEP